MTASTSSTFENSGSTNPPDFTLNPFLITNIKAFIPITLKLNAPEFRAWKALFKNHVLTFSVSDHLDASLTLAQLEAAWTCTDSLVKSWLFGSLSPAFFRSLKDDAEKSAAHVWNRIDLLLQSHKDVRSVHLVNQFHDMVLGDSSVDDFCDQLK